MEAVELAGADKVKPKMFLVEFKELSKVREKMENGDIAGRVVLRVGDDPGRWWGWRASCEVSGRPMQITWRHFFLTKVRFVSHSFRGPGPFSYLAPEVSWWC